MKCKVSRIFFLFFLILISSATLSKRKEASLVVDASTGKVLHAENAETLIPPASLTKIMTILMLYKALNRGEITFYHRIPMTVFGAQQEPCKIGLKPGKTLTVKEAILAMCTNSSNDVAEAVADFLTKGHRQKFYKMMTSQAKKLGMKHTSFGNASGLPNPQSITTAKDMAILGMALIRYFPEYYHFFSAKAFQFQGRSFHNHNHLLGKHAVDGIKTGFFRAVGSNLVASSKRNGKRLVGVILGGSSWHARDRKMVQILEEGFRVSGNYTPSYKSPPSSPRPASKKELPQIVKKFYNVHFGSYTTKEKARFHVMKLIREHEHLFLNHPMNLIHGPKRKNSHKFFAQIISLNQEKSQKICALLHAENKSCKITLQPENSSQNLTSLSLQEAFSYKPLKYSQKKKKKRKAKKQKLS
jgi:D-alanyl-D-alanine carboxypeptidase